MTQSEARAELRRILKPGGIVYTILRHVSRSGMHRRISLQTADHQQLDWLIDRAGWGRTSKRGEGLVADGCGMDMGFHLVYNLGACIWPEGTPEPHGTRNGEPDTAGGYALKHRWI
jgi:hypothetical protein